MRMDEFQSSVEVISIQLAELVRSTPQRNEVDPGGPKPVSFQQVAELIDNSAERVCSRMSEMLRDSEVQGNSRRYGRCSEVLGDAPRSSEIPIFRGKSQRCCSELRGSEKCAGAPRYVEDGLKYAS